jgi:hypothetical protein
MSKQTRSTRRQERGSSPTAPKSWRSDWRVVGILAAVLLIGAVGVYQNVLQHSDIATATATPTPNGGMGAAIALADGEELGAAVFPARDAATGGHGQAVNGIGCSAQEQVAFHIHAHLAIFAQGKQVQVAAQIGFPSDVTPCLYWLHTHDASGIIHVEAPVYHNFTVGDFFDIWGQPIDGHHLGSLRGALHAFVNGSEYSGDLRAIPLRDHQQITLEIGAPYIPPPNYRFPAGDT